jgi:hypothetical protein
MSAEIVNLNKSRKIFSRKRKLHQSSVNSIKFGRTKAEKAHDEYRARRQKENLIGKQLDVGMPEG